MNKQLIFTPSALQVYFAIVQSYNDVDRNLVLDNVTVKAAWESVDTNSFQIRVCAPDLVSLAPEDVVCISPGESGNFDNSTQPVADAAADILKALQQHAYDQRLQKPTRLENRYRALDEAADQLVQDAFGTGEAHSEGDEPEAPTSGAPVTYEVPSDLV